jgi:capsular polysaccharide biosynthesis protein
MGTSSITDTPHLGNVGGIQRYHEEYHLSVHTRVTFAPRLWAFIKRSTAAYLLLKLTLEPVYRAWRFAVGRLTRWLMARSGLRERLYNPARVMFVDEWLQSGPAADRPRPLHIVDGLDFDPAPPLHLDAEPHPELEAFRHLHAATGRIVRLRCGRVQGRDGATITADGVLLLEASDDVSFGPSNHRIFTRPLWHPPRRLAGRWVVALGSWADNYYHWLYDVVPRLLLLKRLDPAFERCDGILVPSRRQPFHGETLRCLDVPEGKLLEVEDDDAFFEADELLVPVWTRGFGAANYGTPPWLVEDLRRIMLPDGAPAPAERVRLYVSRGDAGARSVANESEVMAVLRDYGFTPVRFAGMGLRDQARLFASAEAIVAPHGAALANLVYCRPGTKVIECFPSLYVNFCYWPVAAGNALSYGYVIGDGPRLPTWMPVRLGSITVTIPVDKLRRMLARMEIRPQAARDAASCTEIPRRSPAVPMEAAP